MQNNEVVRTDNVETLAALNKSEIDVQISTAKRYPRVVAESLNRIEAIATVNQKTAEECFYALPRDGKALEGPSIRFAEIVATCWGNLRVQAQIIGNDGHKITARGICHDLETNVAFCSEVSRRITTKEGRPFSEDMQIVTGNAASAIAIRNAIFKCVPVAVLANATAAIKQKAIGSGSEEDVTARREKMLAYFAKNGVTEDMILFFLQIDHKDAIGAEEIYKLVAVNNAVKEGTSSFKQALIDPFEQSKKQAKAEAKATSARDRVAAAMRANAKPIEAEEVVDGDMPLFDNEN